MNVENFYATIILILDGLNNSDKTKKFHVRFFTRIEIFEFHRKINNIESIFNQFRYSIIIETSLKCSTIRKFTLCLPICWQITIETIDLMSKRVKNKFTQDLFADLFTDCLEDEYTITRDLNTWVHSRGSKHISQSFVPY